MFIVQYAAHRRNKPNLTHVRDHQGDVRHACKVRRSLRDEAYFTAGDAFRYSFPISEGDMR